MFGPEYASWRRPSSTFSAQLQPATKDANNPFTESMQVRHLATASCTRCRDALLSNGIWLCQYPVPAEPAISPAWSRKLTHAESGQWQSSLAVVPLPKADPPGSGGISMTYMRRYALSAMLGICYGGGYGWRAAPKSVKNGHTSKNAHKGVANQKRCFTKENTSGFGFQCLKSNVRRTFETAGSGRNHLSGRSGTEWPTVHRRRSGIRFLKKIHLWLPDSNGTPNGKYGGDLPHSRKSCP